MDIASLLSNEADTNGTSSNTNGSGPPKKHTRPLINNRTPSLLSQEVLITSPPESSKSVPPSNLASVMNAGTAALQPARPTSGTPSSEPPTSFHQPNHLPTSGEQYRDSSNDNSPVQQLSHLAQTSTASQLRPSLAVLRSPSLAQIHGGARTYSASDIVMAEAPAQTPPPRKFTASSISEDDLRIISELTSSLSDHSYDYNSHVQLISILHRGLVVHADATIKGAQELPQPQDYALLKELRMAREAMASRYAPGEDIWRDWINDESLLARTSEDRTAVMELCMKAVQEEPSSVVLWSLYGEWVWSTYAVSNGLSEGDEDTWTEEDKMICKEVFTKDMVTSVWTEAVKAVRFRVDEGSLVWDRYLEWITQDLPSDPPLQTVEDLQAIYMQRLRDPQNDWESTSQRFWHLISKHKPNGWEEIMSATNEIAGPGKQAFALRQEHETEITRAFRSNDSTALYNAFAAYLQWEAKHGRRRQAAFDQELRCALYERALLRFPTMVEWWLDYADYLTSVDSGATNILPLLERATRHCPWSGELWSRRLLRVELETRNYELVEEVKHKATNSGLLPIGGIEEILVLYASWCSYLVRRAFQMTASEDDLDMADMAITGVLSDILHDGKKTYGDTFKGDPHWRIEKIFVKFLTQAQRVNEARNFWRTLVPVLCTSYDFWAQWYTWEIFVWGAERTLFNLKDQTPEGCPHKASAVLHEAMTQKDLDWPEKVQELFAHHFQTYEVAAELQKAQVELRAAQRRLKYRREKEAADAAAAAEAQTTAATDDTFFSAKRKRDDHDSEQHNGHDAAKKSRHHDTYQIPDDRDVSPSTSTAQLKRSREQNTITVKHLASATTEKRIRQFFSDCGDILSLAIVPDDSSATAHATIEFATHDDVLTAKTRDGKVLDGREVRIQSGTMSTLYVTNYPDSFAEDEIRALFEHFGTIVSIRLPSLRYNQRRRFCYVQFLTPEEARAATSLHDKVLDAQHRLVVLISDPDAKKNRQGATAEGREIHVGNVGHSVTEDELKEYFGTVGAIESIRTMKNAGNKFTGTAFVVFTSADDARQALTLNQKPLGDRLLRVTLATDKSTRDASNKKHGTTKVFDTRASASPGPDNVMADADDAAAAAAAANGETITQPSTEIPAIKDRHARTIAVLHLPETVNDARVRALLEPFGPIRKIAIRRDKAGAIVEFANVEDAGRASLSADATVLGPECKVGDVPALLATKLNRKTGQPIDTAAVSGGAAASGSSPPVRLAAALVSRPSVSRPGQKGGRKVGLGFRAARPGGSGMAGQQDAAAEGGDEVGEKSNADFREMFLAAGAQKSDEANEQGSGNG